MEYEESVSVLSEFSSDLNTRAFKSTDYFISETRWNLDIVIPCYNVEKRPRRMHKPSNLLQLPINCYKGRLNWLNLSIVEEYVDQSNVLIIHQENKGFSGARNTGLDLSNSAYIMFVDSGDFLPDGAIQVLMSVAKLNDAEVVRGRVFLCW